MKKVLAPELTVASTIAPADASLRIAAMPAMMRRSAALIFGENTRPHS